MKKNTYVKILASVMAVFLCLITYVSTYAADKDPASEEMYKVAISTLALLSDKKMQQVEPSATGVEVFTELHVYDFLGEEITKDFLSEAMELYMEEDWESLRKYSAESIQKITRIVDIVQPRRDDIAKTRTSYNAEVLTDSMNRSCTVTYHVRGTIYYNPNTYYISIASTPIRTSLTTAGPSYYTIVTSHESASSSIASNHLSATFHYSFKVSGQSAYGNTVFGTTSHSFSITPS